MATMLVLLLALAAMASLWMHGMTKPQPVKVRRNLLQEELLSRYINQRADYR